MGAAGLVLAGCAIFGQPAASAQAFHCCTVTSNLPIANAAPRCTWCAGFSLGSLALFPIANVSAGSTTSTGQPGQSRTSGAVPAGAGGGGLTGAAAGFVSWGAPRKRWSLACANAAKRPFG